MNLVVVAGSGNPSLADSIAERLGTRVCRSVLNRFPDSELHAEIDESVLFPLKRDRYFFGFQPSEAFYTVPWVTVENPKGLDLAKQWIQSKKEHVASAGWCTYSGIVATKADDALDLAEIESLLNTIVPGIKSAQNRVRYTMNGFVIAVGTYVKPLLKQAKAAARQIGTVAVDVGDTDASAFGAGASSKLSRDSAPAVMTTVRVFDW